jgi:hypothetical protein
MIWAFGTGYDLLAILIFMHERLFQWFLFTIVLDALASMITIVDAIVDLELFDSDVRLTRAIWFGW